MTSLMTLPNLTNPDDVYAMLIAAHEGLSKADSDALNARLVLILINHTGDEHLIREALALARLPILPADQ